MGRHHEERRKGPSSHAAAAPTARRVRPGLVPWFVRAADLLALLRTFARERCGTAVEDALAQRFGGPPQGVHPADLQRAEDDAIMSPGSFGDGRSILRAFAEESEGLDAAERAQLLRWEKERRRGVYLLERCHREWMEGWDPLEGKRVVIHFPEPLAAGRAAALRRGTVVTALTLPWNERHLAEGAVEMFEDEEAIRLFRNEVRGAGHPWHDPPPPAPVAGG